MTKDKHHEERAMTQSGERLIKAAGQAREIARGDREPAKMHMPPETPSGKANLEALIAVSDGRTNGHHIISWLCLQGMADYVRELEAENAWLRAELEQPVTISGSENLPAISVENMRLVMDEIEERTAKAEAKRQRRAERNRRMMEASHDAD